MYRTTVIVSMGFPLPGHQLGQGKSQETEIRVRRPHPLCSPPECPTNTPEIQKLKYT